MGCGGGTLIVLAVLGALAWFLVIQPVRGFLASWQTPTTVQTQTQTPQGGGTGVQVPSLPGGDTGPGTTPAPGGNVGSPVTQADVGRFARVRQDVSAALGGSFTNLQNVWTDIQNGQTPNILTIVGVLRDAGTSIGRARQAQATALAREGLSAERYATIRSTVNRALGLPNVDFARAAEAIQAGRLPDLNTAVQTATPQERQLVEPYRQGLTQTAALGLLGL
ncbi:hypothetical protein DAETH_08370 [Deinococcus aetherius]|uniref:Uncharacterized protein n=1 Tax=Deinococcus aetherius TaxID=200252 RepID=A0ABN6RFP9_9DEIO|nr:hypothetical protein DAETH_08370 [Deinococcus aetherius]